MGCWGWLGSKLRFRGEIFYAIQVTMMQIMIRLWMLGCISRCQNGCKDVIMESLGTQLCIRYTIGHKMEQK